MSVLSGSGTVELKQNFVVFLFLLLLQYYNYSRNVQRFDVDVRSQKNGLVYFRILKLQPE